MKLTDPIIVTATVDDTNYRHFKHFGIHPSTCILYGKKEDEIIELELRLSKNHDKPSEKDELKLEADYWGWHDKEAGKFTLIYPKRFLLNMCFPYGLRGAEEAMKGKAYRLEIVCQTKHSYVYVVHSNHEGVSEVKKMKVVGSKYNAGTITYQTDDLIPQKYHKFELAESPFEFEMVEGHNFYQRDECGSGVGDLWAYCNYFSFDAIEAEKYRIKEEIRINDKYLSGKAEEEIIMPCG